RDILAALAPEGMLPEKYYTFTDGVNIAGVRCLVSQTGYTGEHGYELYCAPNNAAALWQALLEAGAAYGLMSCGLGARDTLRLEAAMPLYGHEMDETITPFEAGLGFAVKMKKPAFIGKKALEENANPSRVRVGLKMTGRGIAREQCPVLLDGREIGLTTSGTHLPYLAGAYAMALIDSGHSTAGTTVEVEVRGRKIAAEIVPLPFYSRAK
ncbi:MAG: glycine cleavage system aminomethyltransferase GcvT, partial [Oscillospiraceae bacterium]|nr:glycine cleavage system aminomethyltransferase GcvT [Oscillospiraceae bacterium]